MNNLVGGKENICLFFFNLEWVIKSEAQLTSWKFARLVHAKEKATKSMLPLDREINILLKTIWIFLTGSVFIVLVFKCWVKVELDVGYFLSNSLETFLNERTAKSSTVVSLAWITAANWTLAG